MSRRQRLHVPGGTYYVVQRGSTTRPIFSQHPDYLLFERLLATALRRTGARLHAYCWTPDAIHLALQIDSVSVGRFMQGITSRYARSIHERAAESGHFFRQRYKAILVDPDAYLLKLVRYVHHLPVIEALSSEPGGYPFTSHAAYLGRTETAVADDAHRDANDERLRSEQRVRGVHGDCARRRRIARCSSTAASTMPGSSRAPSSSRTCRATCASIAASSRSSRSSRR